MTLKFDGWPQNIIGNVFYITSSFVHHFKSISELQSGKAQFGLKSTIFLVMWLWNLTCDLEKQFYATSSFVHHFVANGKLKLELQSGNAQFGSKLMIFFSRVTLQFHVWPHQNNRAPLLCHFKLCASFLSHWTIQTGVTVRKHLIWVKIDDFSSRVTLRFDVWPS